MKNRKMNKRFKISRKLFLFIICTFLFFFLSLTGCVHMRKGNLVKHCAYTDDDTTPIQGAYVWIEELDLGAYTDHNGNAYFYDLLVGTYHIYVNLTDNETWDTEDEEFVIEDGQTTNKFNNYAPLTI